jgi:hypothetical protein
MSRTVDLHHHVIPDFYWEASNEDGHAAGGITPPRWSLDAAIAYLDEARIDVAVASISTPGVHFGDDAAARNLARQVNEHLADIKRDRPDRFGAFAAQLQTTAELDDGERRGVLGASAARLIPRLTRAASTRSGDSPQIASGSPGSGDDFSPSRR